MTTGSRVPAVEHPNTTAADEGGLSTTAGGNPVVHFQLRVGGRGDLVLWQGEEGSKSLQLSLDIINNESKDLNRLNGMHV